MLWKVFAERLGSLNSRQEVQTTELADEYCKDLADVQATVLQYARRGDPDAHRALFVIAQLGETAVESLANSIAEQEAVSDANLLMQMVNGIIYAENAVIGRLKAALNDTRLVPQLPGMSVLEEVDPRHRVCDEAYTALRRILNPELLLQYLAESRHFLSLPDTAKNHEIEFWLRTGTFTPFLEDLYTGED